MSAIIRAQLEKDLLTGIEKSAEADQALKNNDYNKLLKLGELISRLIFSIQNLLNQWTDVLTKLAPDQRPAEEALFTAFQTKDKKPIDMIHELTGTRVEIKMKLENQEREPIIRTPSESTNNNGAKSIPYQLPILSIAPFDGTYSNWPSFSQLEKELITIPTFQGAKN
jgi:hypothetical protein